VEWCLINRETTLPLTLLIIHSEVKRTLKRLPHLFLGDLLAVVRCSSSVLKAPSGKLIFCSCSQAIISSLLQLCAGGFSRRTLWYDALSITIHKESSKFGKVGSVPNAQNSPYSLNHGSLLTWHLKQKLNSLQKEIHSVFQHGQ